MRYAEMVRRLGVKLRPAGTLPEDAAWNAPRPQQAPSISNDGYIVVRGAVPVATCDRILGALGTELGLWVDDPTTWRRADEHGIDQVPLWGHQSLWDVRQLPRLHAIWRDIWGTERLWVDRNSCRFTLPYPHGRTGAIPIHWDDDPHERSLQWYPGIVALTDTPAGAGGFRCVPSLYHDRAAWPAEWPNRPWGRSYDAPVGDREVVEVPCGRGDLIVFDHRLPHGTVENQSDHPRVVFYLQCVPAGPAADAIERVHDHLTGRCPSHWRWKPGHDRVEPGPPARLTTLGRRLLGFDAWPYEPPQ